MTIAVTSVKRMGFPAKQIREAQRGFQIIVNKQDDGSFVAKANGQELSVKALTQEQAVRDLQKMIQRELVAKDSKITQPMLG